jgi:hypothetical protein
MSEIHEIAKRAMYKRLLYAPEGRPPKHLAVFQYAKWKCERCGAIYDLTRDHVVPRSMGGGDHMKNMQCLCLRCNQIKGANIAIYTTRKKVVDYVERFIERTKTLTLDEEDWLMNHIEPRNCSVCKELFKPEWAHYQMCPECYAKNTFQNIYDDGWMDHWDIID